MWKVNTYSRWHVHNSCCRSLSCSPCLIITSSQHYTYMQITVFYMSEEVELFDLKYCIISSYMYFVEASIGLNITSFFGRMRFIRLKKKIASTAKTLLFDQDCRERCDRFGSVLTLLDYPIASIRFCTVWSHPIFLA